MTNGNHNHDDHDGDSADRDLVRRLAAGDPGGPSLTDMLDGVAQAAEADGLLDVAWAPMDSPVGPLTLAATPEGVVRIEFGRGEQLIEDLATKVSPRVLRAPQRLDPLRRELDEYFVGKRHVFEVPVDWRLSRGFRLTALQELFDVPYGHTVSYKQLAERAGSPKASRAIGGAMATNPVPIVVPCHRVLRTGGDLGGYGGGLDAKRWLLRLEGALLA